MKADSRVLRKGLKILELVARAKDGITVVELEELMGIHKVSVYRYLSVFAREGFVEKRDARYYLGPKILELASLLLDSLEVRKVAHPLLAALSERLQITVHLAQLAGSEVLYIDKIETAHSLPLYSRVGRKAPVYCTALGKAILAFLPEEWREEILRGVELKPYTDRTLTDMDSLIEELEETRRRGYAVDLGEHEEGIACVATPIFDFYGDPMAAVSVTDLIRKVQGKEEVLARHVMQTAEEISRRLGWRSP
jgi:DNA-binding IclR family transcriptional regulator